MTAHGFALFDTTIGRCGIAWGARGISGVQLPEASEAKTRARLTQRYAQAREAALPAEVQRAIEAIAALLDGEPKDLCAVALDMDGIAEFDRRVYEAARAIPAGATLAIGERGACGDCARCFVDAAIEFGDAVHVERNSAKVLRLTIEQRGDRLDRALHFRRQRRFPRLRIALREARAGFCLARLRQLHPADAARAPCDAAAADRRVEECKPVCRHGGSS